MQFRIVSDGSARAFAAQATLAGIIAGVVGLFATALATVLAAHQDQLGQMPWTAVLLVCACLAGLPACLGLMHWARRPAAFTTISPLPLAA